LVDTKPNHKSNISSSHEPAPHRTENTHHPSTSENIQAKANEIEAVSNVFDQVLESTGDVNQNDRNMEKPSKIGDDSLISTSTKIIRDIKGIFRSAPVQEVVKDGMNLIQHAMD
jgi:hypothetical protein